MILNKAQLLSQRFPTERVKVPWIDGDGEIIVRALPAYVVDHYVAMDRAKDKPDVFAFVHAVISESGERIFTDADIPAVAEQIDNSILQLVVAVAFRLAVISPERQEHIKKNSSPMLTGSSGE